MTPRLGMDVLYTATQADVESMKRRRGDAMEFQRRASKAAASTDTPLEPGDLAGRSGHQSHVGNELEVGRRYAAKIVRLWSGTTANLQVFLDGNDVLWATSVSEGDGPGQYVVAI